MRRYRFFMCVGLLSCCLQQNGMLCAVLKWFEHLYLLNIKASNSVKSAQIHASPLSISHFYVEGNVLTSWEMCSFAFLLGVRWRYTTFMCISSMTPLYVLPMSSIYTRWLPSGWFIVLSCLINQSRQQHWPLKCFLVWALHNTEQRFICKTLLVLFLQST